MTPPANPTPDPTPHRDACDVLAWIERGMPDSQLCYAPDAPKLTEDQHRQFNSASSVRAPAAAPARRRNGPAT